MHRSTALIAVSFLFLAACGGSGGGDVACDQTYWDGTVGTCLPEGWIVIEREALQERGIPGETIVAFQAEKPFSGQYPTVTVTRETLDDEVPSDEYSEASIESVLNLPGYEELDTQSMTIDDEDVQMHVFSAQPRPEDPKAKFYQVSFSGDKAGYTLTAAVPLAVSDETEDAIVLILENATLVEPAEDEETEEEDA